VPKETDNETGNSSANQEVGHDIDTDGEQLQPRFDVIFFLDHAVASLPPDAIASTRNRNMQIMDEMPNILGAAAFAGAASEAYASECRGSGRTIYKLQ